VNLSGGTHRIFGSLLLNSDNTLSDFPSFNVSNGATLIVSGTARIGGGVGNGVFNQTGGSAAFGSFVVGSSVAQGKGTVNLSGGLFQVTNDASVETIGCTPGCTFNQSGGTNVASNFSFGSGTYTLSAGSLIVLRSGTMGNLNSANFIQTGGTAVFANSLDLASSNPGGLVTIPVSLTISGGSFGVTGGATSLCNIGLSSPATMTISNAIASFSGSVVLGNQTALGYGRGVLNICNGASVSISGTLELGHTNTLGAGTVNLSGGALDVQGGYIIGDNFVNPSTFNMTGGLLTSTGTSSSYVGYDSISGTSMFNQSGGTHIVSSLTIGPSTGLYSISAGASLVVNGDLTIAGHYGASFVQTGGTTTVHGAFVTSGQVTMSGGSFSAAATRNDDGTIVQTGGTSFLGPLSGIGSVSVGATAGAAAHMTVTSLVDYRATIQNTGTLTIASNIARFTSTVTNVTLSGSGTLDLTNQELLIRFPAPGTIKAALASAYNGSGNQDWSGPGLTSSLARANPQKYTVAYAVFNDRSAQDANVRLVDGTLPSNTSMVVRATLTGDANMDGTVNFFDLAQLLAYKYNTGQAASYTDGDLNYDGVVDFFDITTLLSANYNTGESFTGSLAPGVAATPTAITPEPCAIATALLAAAWPLHRPRKRRRPFTANLRKP
jgi:hypothetical protein